MQLNNYTVIEFEAHYKLINNLNNTYLEVDKESSLGGLIWALLLAAEEAANEGLFKPE